jgi:methylated-DNA-[protein]-cysteine S-methyltransferase
MNPAIYFQILEENNKVVEILLNKKQNYGIIKNSESKKCKNELEEYLSGKRKKFDVKLKYSGTIFQMAVWNEMMKIPYGKTVSYKELAMRIGKPNAYRAVANACGANKLPIIIPCHRVVASSGLGGYSAGIEIKKKLLELERINKNK